MHCKLWTNAPSNFFRSYSSKIGQKFSVFWLMCYMHWCIMVCSIMYIIILLPNFGVPLLPPPKIFELKISFNDTVLQIAQCYVIVSHSYIASCSLNWLLFTQYHVWGYYCIAVYLFWSISDESWKFWPTVFFLFAHLLKIHFFCMV